MSYLKCRYQNLLGCSNIDLTNTTELYARFTTSVICNAIIQNSKDNCQLTTDQLEPLCADTCVSDSKYLINASYTNQFSRVNMPSVKEESLMMLTFALPPVLILTNRWNRFAQILSPVHCPQIRWTVENALLASITSQTTAVSEQVQLDCAATVEPVARIRQTPAVITLRRNPCVLALSFPASPSQLLCHLHLRDHHPHHQLQQRPHQSVHPVIPRSSQEVPLRVSSSVQSLVSLSLPDSSCYV